MRLDQTGPAVADQQRLEDAVAANHGEVIGVQQRRPRLTHLAVQRDDHTRLPSHGRSSLTVDAPAPRIAVELTCEPRRRRSQSEAMSEERRT